jgi:hypothetical protein
MYHLVALWNLEEFARTYRYSGQEMPREYTAGLERMWNYTASVMRPNGTGPLNNDSDLYQYRPDVLKAAEQYNRPDWRFIATNGAEGTRPEGLPSVMFPWAGQLVMRDGYGADAQWAFFDIGPWGTGHQHNDHLHLSVTAGGRDLLVDSGRFAYGGQTAAKFGPGYKGHSAGHNVILVDGCGQQPGPLRTEQPLAAGDWRITPEFDFARGSFEQFEGLEGQLRHTRALVYVRGFCWVVVDRIETDRPRRLEALWHWHPRCTVTVQGRQTESTDPDTGNLRIAPLGDVDWQVALVKGQDTPRVQGWYSPEYNHFEPSPAAVYSAQVSGSTAFAWVLIPGQGAVPPMDVSIMEQSPDCMTIRVCGPEGSCRDVTVPLAGDREPAVVSSANPGE